MRLIKAALLVAMGFSLLWMWSSRDYIVAAYQTSPDVPPVRLSGVDLAVAKSTTTPSPYVIPAAPDTRNRPVPVLAMTDAVDAAAVSVSISGGKALLGGTVTGPDGAPVEGATVELQRHTSRGTASKVLVTNAGGQWSAPGLPGGRYRARAWVPGVLAMGGSTVVFLAEDDSVDLPFSLWGIDPAPQLEFVHSGELYIGVPGTLAVVVTSKIIDDRGVVLTVPMVGAPVTVQTTQHVTVLSVPLQHTGNDGAARFAVVCQRPDVAGNTVEPTMADDISNADATADGQSTDGTAPTPSAIGTLIARSGDVVGGFVLPTCVPAPAQDPIGGAAEPVTGAQGHNDG